MTVSSRTPEGQSHLCPVCGKWATTEPSYPGGDSTCPSCGHLLWWFRDRFGQNLELYSSLTEDAGIDSLDVVELVMELEEEFNLTIPDSDLGQIETIADLIRYIQKLRTDEAA
jgi:acyl carrier protein